MRRNSVGWMAVFAATLLCSTIAWAESPVERGKYLVTLAGCTDCHTPGHLLGKPDMTRYLGGSDVGFFVPGMGTFYGPNLTSDKATGLGGWTDAQVIHVLKTGERPDGRVLAPPMPWRAIGQLTDSDLTALVAYLRAIPVVEHKVPGPFGPNETASEFVMKIIPPGG